MTAHNPTHNSRTGIKLDGSTTKGMLNQSWKTIPMDQVIDTSVYDEKRMISILNCSKGKETEMIPRKVINAMYKDVDYLETAEDVIQNYMQCMIERFRGDQYGEMREDILGYPQSTGQVQGFRGLSQPTSSLR